MAHASAIILLVYVCINNLSSHVCCSHDLDFICQSLDSTFLLELCCCAVVVFLLLLLLFFFWGGGGDWMVEGAGVIFISMLSGIGYTSLPGS